MMSAVRLRCAWVLASALAGCTTEASRRETTTSEGTSSQALLGVTGLGPACAESAMRCTWTFAYVDRGEASAEVRGDFRAGAWTAGVPMKKRGKTWTADVDIPYGRDVQYKLFLDGARWAPDPGNPARAGDNSVLQAVTCNPHRCEAP
jgi:hypothetical protein